MFQSFRCFFVCFPLFFLYFLFQLETQGSWLPWVPLKGTQGYQKGYFWGRFEHVFCFSTAFLLFSFVFPLFLRPFTLFQIHSAVCALFGWGLGVEFGALCLSWRPNGPYRPDVPPQITLVSLNRPRHKAGLKWTNQTCSRFEICIFNSFEVNSRFDSASFKPAFWYQTCLCWGLL